MYTHASPCKLCTCKHTFTSSIVVCHLLSTSGASFVSALASLPSQQEVCCWADQTVHVLAELQGDTPFQPLAGADGPVGSLENAALWIILPLLSHAAVILIVTRVAVARLTTHKPTITTFPYLMNQNVRRSSAQFFTPALISIPGLWRGSGGRGRRFSAL